MQPLCLSMSLHYYNWKCRAVGAAEVWQRSVLYPITYLLHQSRLTTMQEVVAQKTAQRTIPSLQLTARESSDKMDVQHSLTLSTLAGNGTLPSGCLPEFQYTREVVGWHASYFFNKSGIENKLRSFWHAHEPATVNMLHHQEQWDTAIVRCEDLFCAVAGTDRQGFQMASTPLTHQRLPICHTLVGYYLTADNRHSSVEQSQSLNQTVSHKQRVSKASSREHTAPLSAEAQREGGGDASAANSNNDIADVNQHSSNWLKISLFNDGEVPFHGPS